MTDHDKYRGRTPDRPYAFVRKEGFYIIEAFDDVEVLNHVECNPGTLKIISPEGAVLYDAGKLN